ncbi:DUF2184 domain-containing protein [Enterobacter kobei]|uniref:DUF2184 domain-containing protein n=1 Tax=Enterobacter kobei TaxID=208224 RepID=UPI00067FB2B0|nr:major capsid family protein [Enterobacter kobei]
MERHMNYDELDLQAIEVSSMLAGMNMDEGESIFLARELDYVKSRVYEKEYPALTATTLFPVTSEIPSWAKTFTYGIFDAVGMAKIIADYSDDLLNVGVNFREETGKVYALGNFYQYSIMEIRASQATGKNLDTRLASAARRAHELKVNQLAYHGDPDYQITGFLAHPNIPATVSAGWTTGEIASTELENAVTGIETVTKGLHSPNLIALAPSAFKVLSRPMPNTNTSYMTYFNTQYPGLQWVRVNELENIDGAGTRAAIVMERDADNASMELPQPFEQLPPQAEDLHFKIPCHSRATGVQVYRPLTINIIKGI